MRRPGLIYRGKVAPASATVPMIRMSDLIGASQFASTLGASLTAMERGLLSEEDARRRLKGIGFTDTQAADVIAARRKRLLRLAAKGGRPC